MTNPIDWQNYASAPMSVDDLDWPDQDQDRLGLVSIDGNWHTPDEVKTFAADLVRLADAASKVKRDLESSASRQHFIDTGEYLLATDTNTEEA